MKHICKVMNNYYLRKNKKLCDKYNKSSKIDNNQKFVCCCCNQNIDNINLSKFCIKCDQYLCNNCKDGDLCDCI
jgi:hypothetical protein